MVCKLYLKKAVSFLRDEKVFSNSMGIAGKKTWGQMPITLQLLVGWPWVSYLMPLLLSFPIPKMVIRIPLGLL